MEPYWYDRPDARRPARHDLLPEDTDTVVVGAGITGLTTALLLARAGRRVVVLEARNIGAVTTGRTTGKVSLLQGTKLSRMLELQSEHVTRSYLDANSEGQAWLLRFLADHDVPVETRDAITFALKPDQIEDARAEHNAARSLGLPTEWRDHLDLPFPTFGGTVLADQAQIDPADVLAALVEQVTAHGGTVHEGTRVVSVSKIGRPEVRTEDGAVLRCTDVVLATGTPVLDRGLYFAKLEANRSYVLMFAGVEPPESMLLSAGQPSISVRSVAGADGERLLMVGGNGHVVGRTSSERRRVEELREWTADNFPGARETHAWSAQDYSSHDGIPFVGKLPRGLGRIHLATGYDKWGLTNGVAAGLRIAGEILGQTPSWAKPMGRRITRPGGALAIASTNVKVGIALTGGLVGAALRTVPDRPDEGAGAVGRDGVVPLATSTVDGSTCTVAALCTHLGGVLSWNDHEKSWDCPLHGSRFAPDGSVLEGPATRPLRVHDAAEGVSTPHDAPS